MITQGTNYILYKDRQVWDEEIGSRLRYPLISYSNLSVMGQIHKGQNLGVRSKSVLIMVCIMYMNVYTPCSILRLYSTELNDHIHVWNDFWKLHLHIRYYH